MKTHQFPSCRHLHPDAQKKGMQGAEGPRMMPWRLSCKCKKNSDDHEKQNATFDLRVEHSEVEDDFGGPTFETHHNYMDRSNMIP